MYTLSLFGILYKFISKESKLVILCKLSIVRHLFCLLNLSIIEKWVLVLLYDFRVINLFFQFLTWSLVIYILIFSCFPWHHETAKKISLSFLDYGWKPYSVLLLSKVLAYWLRDILYHVNDVSIKSYFINSIFIIVSADIWQMSSQHLWV